MKLITKISNNHNTKTQCLNKYPSKIKEAERWRNWRKSREKWLKGTKWVKKRTKRSRNERGYIDFERTPLRFFPGYYQQFRGEYIIPLDPGVSRGSLIPTWLYKGTTHRHGDVGRGRRREEGKGSNTFSTHYDLYPAGKPRPA